MRFVRVVCVVTLLSKSIKKKNRNSFKTEGGIGWFALCVCVFQPDLEWVFFLSTGKKKTTRFSTTSRSSTSHLFKGVIKKQKFFVLLLTSIVPFLM